MIISFNPAVFDAADAGNQEALAKVIDLVSEQRFHVRIDNSINTFIDEEGNYIFDTSNFAKHYLSKNSANKLKERIYTIISSDAYITEIHTKYLTSFTIGLQENEVLPNVAFMLLSQPSKLILENGTNDWKFIEGICEKYKSHKKRKSIYKIVHTAISRCWIEAENAGGAGGINKRIQHFINLYGKYSKYKIATLFDSDRRREKELRPEKSSIISFIKGETIKDIEDIEENDGDTVVWHMLYKREIENYIPIDVLSTQEILSEKTKSLRNISPTEYDYVDFEEHYKGLDYDTKSEFPELFKNEFNRELLETRCNHHKVKLELPNGTLEDISEIEEILVKITKII